MRKPMLSKTKDERKESDVKKYIPRAVCLILFFVLLIALYAGFDYVISDDTSSQTRVTFHDYYEAGKIDYLFIGPSHSIHEINAVKLSEDLDKNVFNLTSAGQDFIGTYYLLKEAFAEKRTDRIFMELSASRLAIKETDETAAYIISDYIKSPLIRAQYLFKSFDMDGYINAFLRLRRNIDPQHLPSASELTKTYRKKSDPTYGQFDGTEKYMGKGQWAVWSSWANDETGTVAVCHQAAGLNNFKPEAIQEREVSYLKKIIALCKENGAELTFYLPPYSDLYLMHFKQYEQITETFYQIAQEAGIPIIDFNKVRDEYLQFSLADFYNPDHLNVYASDRIADFLELYINDPDGDYFYKTLQEKHPVTDDILAVAYDRYFVTEDAEFPKLDQVEGDIQSMRLKISAFSWVKRPVDVRLYAAEKQDVPAEDGTEETTPVWIDREEIAGEKIDAYGVQYVVPYKDMKPYYKVELLDPDTHEVLYETHTRFNMK